MGDMGDYWRDVRDGLRKERRAQMQERIQYVCDKLGKKNFDYRLANESTGQFVVDVRGKKFVFYARTGKITNYKQRGLRAFLQILDKAYV